MDASGVDMEVLSNTTPGTQPLSAKTAVALAREANDVLAGAVPRHPDRFAAFATLPMSDPHAAAAELEGAVTRLGHIGAMLFRKPAFATLRLILAGTCDRHPDLLNSGATQCSAASCPTSLTTSPSPPAAPDPPRAPGSLGRIRADRDVRCRLHYGASAGKCGVDSGGTRPFVSSVPMDYEQGSSTLGHSTPNASSP